MVLIRKDFATKLGKSFFVFYNYTRSKPNAVCFNQLENLHAFNRCVYCGLNEMYLTVFRILFISTACKNSFCIFEKWLNSFFKG